MKLPYRLSMMFGWVGFGLLVSTGLAAGEPPAATSASQPASRTLDHSIAHMLDSWKALAQAAESDSHPVAFSNRTPYADAAETPGVLIGFNYALGDFMGPTVSAMQPVYLTEGGVVWGKWIGDATDKRGKVTAPAGYVVTGVRIRAGGNLDGFSLIYSRFSNRLDRGDSLESSWVGRTEGGSIRVILSPGLCFGVRGMMDKRIGSIRLAAIRMEGDQIPDARQIADGKVAFPKAPDDGGTTALAGPPAAAGKAPSPTSAPAGQAAGPTDNDNRIYTSIEEMFEILPGTLQPTARIWIVGTRVSPTLTERLRGKVAQLTGEFGSYKGESDKIELSLDTDELNYRGFKLDGEIFAAMSKDQLEKLKTFKIHDKIVVTGKIKQMVVRGVTARGQAINKAFLWLDDCTAEVQKPAPEPKPAAAGQKV
jgi:hypothetical protein